MSTPRELLDTARRQYPEIHPSDDYCLALWLIHGTSYMAWERGEVVNTCAETDDEVQERRALFARDLAAQQSRVATQEEDAVLDRLLDEVIAEQRAKTPEQRAAEHDAHAAFEAQTVRARSPEAAAWRTLCAGAEAFTLRGLAFSIPLDVTSEWLTAVRRVLAVALGDGLHEEEFPTALDPSINDSERKARRSARMREVCRALQVRVDEQFPEVS